MEFDLQKYLSNNKLTRKQVLREEYDAEDDLDQPDTSDADSWYDSDDSDLDQVDQEPASDEIGSTQAPADDVHSKQATLQALEDKKDALLLQLKSGQMGLDQYRQAIGNIPAQIKKLRADIEKAMIVSTDDEESAEL